MGTKKSAILNSAILNSAILKKLEKRGRGFERNDRKTERQKDRKTNVLNYIINSFIQIDKSFLVFFLECEKIFLIKILEFQTQDKKNIFEILTCEGYNFYEKIF